MTIIKVRPQSIYLKPNGHIPNNSNPVLLYRSVFPSSSVTAESIKAHFTKNHWTPEWEYGMYKRAHYHSTAHEALGVFRGCATVRLGVSDIEHGGGSAVQSEINNNNDVENKEGRGTKVEIRPGDVLVIPAGVAHGCVTDRDGFTMVGAYPQGSQQWDLNYGDEGKEVIDSLPEMDPVLGKDVEGLCGLWK